MLATLANDPTIQNQLEELSTLPVQEALAEAGWLAIELATDRSFRERELPHLLRQAERRPGSGGISCFGDDVGDVARLLVFVWAPAARSAIHDHSSWGAIAPVQERSSRSVSRGWTTSNARRTRACAAPGDTTGGPGSSRPCGLTPAASTAWEPPLRTSGHAAQLRAAPRRDRRARLRPGK